MGMTDLTIKTGRLVLRPFEKADLDEVLSYYSLPDVQRYLDWKARDRTEAKSAFEAMRKQTRLSRPGDSLTLAVVRKADGKVVGHVSLRYMDATAAQAEIRFAVGPAFRRKGYGSEAVGAVISHGFAEHKFHRVFARTAGGNEASAQLLKGLGMRLEAHYREHALFQGEWDEELHFAILDREWQRGAKVSEISRHKVA
ncbi:MAG: GNAT family N-acetyltransferase [Devosia nanyangense]|uniref:GNAT family N-acetyltransferase n=1 Tax=Devosia nanyangense TaxID=1228055 RepID=A0A933L1J1_9HYPH|nr:GNAT family N-acetyltransferase [Devosia nanyangense]